jgi:hypothetical protein
MTWFRCLIRGENFPGELVGQAGRVGFYVTRFVQAADATGAEMQALQELRSEPQLVPPPGYTPSGITRVFFEEIAAVSPDQVPAQRPGFVWYVMEPDAEQGAGATRGR